MQDLVPWPGIKPRPLHWEDRVLITKFPREVPLIFFFLFFLKLHLEQFSFIARLRKRYKDFPYTPSSHTCITSPIIKMYSITHQNDMVHLLYHPKSIVYIRVHSWYCTPLVLDKSIVTYASLKYYTEYFHCPKIPLCSAYLSLPIIPPNNKTSPPHPWQPLIFLLSPKFCLFQNVIQLASKVCSLYRLAFFT